MKMDAAAPFNYPVNPVTLEYLKYLEEPCVWAYSNTTTLSILSSQAEIGIGLLLIISLLSWQRNIVQTFMYWQCLKDDNRNMKVGWFLHTLIPSSQIHRTLPSRFELLRAVLAADFVGVLNSPRDDNGARLQLILYFSPATDLFFYLFPWADCKFVGALGLLRVFIYMAVARFVCQKVNIFAMSMSRYLHSVIKNGRGTKRFSPSGSDDIYKCDHRMENFEKGCEGSVQIIKFAAGECAYGLEAALFSYDSLYVL